MVYIYIEARRSQFMKPNIRHPSPAFFSNPPIKSSIRRAVHWLGFPSPNFDMPDKKTLETIPCGILERIAFFAVASEETFLGPPFPICSMVLISRSVYHKISYKENTHLYSRIFRFKFDYAAPERRLSKRWSTTRCLTSELVKRWQALKRIKAIQLEVDDLWTAYLMLLEDDGRNGAQLFTYAGLRPYLQSLIIFRTQPQAMELAWFKAPAVDSLVLWLLWMSNDRETVRQEDWLFRQCLLGILHSFIINGYRHSAVYAPEIFFSLPLCSTITSVGAFQIPKAEIIHYSHNLSVAVPMIAPAAILALVVHAESFQTLQTLPTNHVLPLDRADAISQDRTGPTVADIQDFHLRNRIALVKRLQPIVNTVFLDDADSEQEGTSYPLEKKGSGCHDEDWYRLVACHDFWDGRIQLRGPVYQLGSLAGSWAGRLLQPDLERFTTLTTNQRSLGYPTISVRYNPLYWNLEEHHCLEPSYPVSPGMDDFFESDDILNAWLPRDISFKSVNEAIEVYDPHTGRTARYATVIPRTAALYGSEKPLRSWISDESDGVIAESVRESEPSSTSANRPSSSSPVENDEYYDTVSHLSSGVSDIIITGKTGEHYGDAWGHYTIYGRVRPWDGLIALLRFPSDPSEQYLGRWIFKGYLHGKNLAGRWRETSTPIESIGYQGGFVMYKAQQTE